MSFSSYNGFIQNRKQQRCFKPTVVNRHPVGIKGPPGKDGIQGPPGRDGKIGKPGIRGPRGLHGSKRMRNFIITKYPVKDSHPLLYSIARDEYNIFYS